MNNKVKNKRISFVVMMLTLSVSIIGATYAYFSLVPPVNNTVKGEAARANLLMEINRVLPGTEAWEASSKVMSPYDGNSIGSIIKSPNYCLDDRDNVACQIYRIKLTNDGTAGISLDGSIVFAGTSEMPNLRWRLLGSNKLVDDDSLDDMLPSQEVRGVVDGEKLYLEEDISMEPDTIKYYYLLMWINTAIDENGNSTFQTDNGTYTASVTFESSNGLGVTSTFVQ